MRPVKIEVGRFRRCHEGRHLRGSKNAGIPRRVTVRDAQGVRLLDMHADGASAFYARTTKNSGDLQVMERIDGDGIRA